MRQLTREAVSFHFHFSCWKIRHETHLKTCVSNTALIAFLSETVQENLNKSSQNLSMPVIECSACYGSQVIYPQKNTSVFAGWKWSFTSVTFHHRFGVWKPSPWHQEAEAPGQAVKGCVWTTMSWRSWRLEWVLIRRSHSKTCQFNLKQAKQVLGELYINLVA